MAGRRETSVQRHITGISCRWHAAFSPFDDTECCPDIASPVQGTKMERCTAIFSLGSPIVRLRPPTRAPNIPAVRMHDVGVRAARAFGRPHTCGTLRTGSRCDGVVETRCRDCEWETRWQRNHPRNHSRLIGNRHRTRLHLLRNPPRLVQNVKWSPDRQLNHPLPGQSQRPGDASARWCSPSVEGHSFSV